MDLIPLCFPKANFWCQAQEVTEERYLKSYVIPTLLLNIDCNLWRFVRLWFAHRAMMHPAPCTAICTTIFSITITPVISWLSAFASLWIRCCSSSLCWCVSMRQSFYDICKIQNPAPRTLPLSALLDRLQNEYDPIVEVSDKLGASADIRGFRASHYTGIDIWLAFDQIIDVQHCLRDVKPAHLNQQDTSFRSHGFKYSYGPT